MSPAQAYGPNIAISYDIRQTVRLPIQPAIGPKTTLRKTDVDEPDQSLDVRRTRQRDPVLGEVARSFSGSKTIATDQIVYTIRPGGKGRRRYAAALDGSLSMATWPTARAPWACPPT